VVDICGVAAVVDTDGDLANRIARRLNDLQGHRGPDEATTLVGEWFCLGHTRLAINALGPPGSQPMVSRNGRWLVAFNGEIYNHRALRSSYSLADIGPSDGAVIPELLDRLGPQAFSRLRGMFAVIAVDLVEEKVILAVDPLGIKPLYWGRQGNRWAAASEVKPLSRVLGATSVDSSAIARFLWRGSMSFHDSGLLGIAKMSPGQWISFNSDGTLLAQGSTIDDTLYAHCLATWDDVAAEFRHSVSAHLMADVPIALLLSDGVDSTAIAWEAAQANAEITAITVNVGGGRRSEATGAATTARHLGLDHVVLDSQPSRSEIRRFFDSMDRPTIDGLNSYLVLREVGDLGFKVALSGVGGDELLTGYTSRLNLRMAQSLSWLPPRLAAQVLATSVPGLSGRTAVQRLAGVNNGHLPADARQFVALSRQVWDHSSVLTLVGAHPSAERSSSMGETLAGRGAATDLSIAQMEGYMFSQLLPDSDVFSMAHSVEMRVPFADTRMTAAVTAVPRRRLSKADFVAALSSPLVSASARRPKQGFTLPMGDWMRGQLLKPFVDELRDRDGQFERVVDPQGVRAALADWDAGRAPWHRVWALVALRNWMLGLQI